MVYDEWILYSLHTTTGVPSIYATCPYTIILNIATNVYKNVVLRNVYILGF